MKLINGRGQLGELFTKNIDIFNNLDITLYHTWNFLDKSEEVQKKLYEDFLKYLKIYSNERIIFISTKSKEDNYYTQYKMLAEKSLIDRCEKYTIIRLPNLIGKGICQKFKENKNIEAYGTLELLSIENAYELIIPYLKLEGIFEIDGEKITANLVKKLICFGKEKEVL